MEAADSVKLAGRRRSASNMASTAPPTASHGVPDVDPARRERRRRDHQLALPSLLLAAAGMALPPSDVGLPPSDVGLPPAGPGTPPRDGVVRGRQRLQPPPAQVRCVQLM
jgi:hypothetical protein